MVCMGSGLITVYTLRWAGFLTFLRERPQLHSELEAHQEARAAAEAKTAEMLRDIERLKVLETSSEKFLRRQ